MVKTCRYNVVQNISVQKCSIKNILHVFSNNCWVKLTWIKQSEASFWKKRSNATLKMVWKIGTAISPQNQVTVLWNHHSMFFAAALSDFLKVKAVVRQTSFSHLNSSKQKLKAKEVMSQLHMCVCVKERVKKLQTHVGVCVLCSEGWGTSVKGSGTCAQFILVFLSVYCSHDCARLLGWPVSNTGKKKPLLTAGAVVCEAWKKTKQFRMIASGG